MSTCSDATVPHQWHHSPLVTQTCQVSRIRHETRAFEVYLTLSRLPLKSHAFIPHLKLHFFCRRS